MAYPSFLWQRCVACDMPESFSVKNVFPSFRGLNKGGPVQIAALRLALLSVRVYNQKKNLMWYGRVEVPFVRWGLKDLLRAL